MRRPIQAAHQPFDVDLCLHAGRGPGAVFQGVGWLHQARREGHRKKGRYSSRSGSERRRSRRCGPAPAYRRRQHRPHSDRGELRRLACRSPSAGTQGVTRWKSSCRPTARSRRRPTPQRQKVAYYGADLELGLQGTLGDSGVRVQSQGRTRLHAGVLRQARQLGARRRQQGLRRRRSPAR